MHKIAGNAPYPSSSLQVSGRIPTTDYDKANIRLEEFVRYFVKIFEATLYAYHLILEGEVQKAGKFSNTLSEKIGQGVGGTTGGLLGFFLGFPKEGAKLGAEGGKVGGNKLGSLLGNKNHKEKVCELFDMVNVSQNGKEYFRRGLVQAGFDVFQSFEMQFMRVTTVEGEKKAMQFLARDAVNRTINYCRQNKDAAITEGVALGESKIESLLGIPIPTTKIKSPGFKIHYKYKSSEEEWYTASLYEKVGLVINEGTPSESTSYHKRINGQSKTDKYGYRRLFRSESWDGLKDKYIAANVLKSQQFLDYQYVLSLKDLENKSNEILKKINDSDERLSIQRTREILEGVRDDILNVLNILIGETQDNKEVNDVLKNLKNLEVDKYLERFEKYFEDARREREAIVKSVETGQEENRENFNKLQEAIHKIVPHESDTKKDNWFNFTVSVKFFVGREVELESLHSTLQNGGGQVVISQTTAITGLGGIGKSELARQYAYDHRKDYNGNVIWINAGTKESLKQSFQELAEKLKIPIKEGNDRTEGEREDRDIKYIVKDVYEYFKDAKSLFIFDNAEEYMNINEFIPVFLSPDNEKPYILITSRNQDWDVGTEGSIKVVKLKDFTPKEAEEFIRKALDIKEEDKSHDEEIMQLANELQYFPLALQQATVYIKEKCRALKARGKTEFGINDYLKEYKEEAKKTKLLDFKSKNEKDRYIETVFTTWKITLTNIKLKDNGKQAIDILDVIAYVAPDRIPIERFFFKLVGDDETLWSAIELLKRYSMINLEDGLSSIHRLVQEVIRTELSNEKKEENVLRSAIELIEGSADATHIVSIWRYASKYSKLIDKFCFSSVYGENKSSPLHLLAENGGDKVIANILNRKHKRKIDSKDIYGRTPLYRAVESGDMKVVTLLVNIGANIHTNTASAPSWNAKGWTVLHAAAYVGNKDAVKYLINKGADINCKDSIGRDSLYIAIYKGNEEVAKLLDKTGENTLSIYAALGKTAQVADILKDKSEEDIRRMTNPAHTGKCGPLHLAAKSGHLHVVKLLVNHGADSNIYVYDGLTPLHIAASEGHLDVVAYLVEEAITKSNGRFDILKVNEMSSWTALHSAAKQGHTEVLKLLISEFSKYRGESTCKDIVNAADAKKTTLLQTAAFHGKLDTVKFLVEQKANINAVDIFGATPLFGAAICNNYNVVKHLLKQEKANIQCDLEKVIGMLDITILHLAAVYDNVEMAKLVAERLRINAGENTSFTPLHVAALFDSQNIIKYLIDNGANPDAEIKFSNMVYVLNFAKDDFKGGYGSEFINNVLKGLKVLMFFRLDRFLRSPRMISTIFKYNNQLVQRDANGQLIQSMGSKVLSLLVSIPSIERQLKMTKDYVLSIKKEEPVPPVGVESIFYGITNNRCYNQQ